VMVPELSKVPPFWMPAPLIFDIVMSPELSMVLSNVLRMPVSDIVMVPIGVLMRVPPTWLMMPLPKPVF